MKMQANHFEHVKKEIQAVLSKYNADNQLVQEYQRGEYPRANVTKDVQRRFCFDLLYGAGLNKFVCDTLYPYLNDDNIYTALKVICPRIEVTQ